MSERFTFNRQERIALLARIASALAPLRLETTPPDRDGNVKRRGWTFCTALHASRIVDDLEYLERSRLEKPRDGGRDDGAG